MLEAQVPSVPPKKDTNTREDKGVSVLNVLEPINIALDFDALNDSVLSTLPLILASEKTGRYVYLQDYGTNQFLSKKELEQRLASIPDNNPYLSQIKLGEAVSAVYLTIAITSSLLWIATYPNLRVLYAQPDQTQLYQNVYNVVPYVTAVSLLLYAIAVNGPRQLREEAISRYNAYLIINGGVNLKNE